MITHSKGDNHGKINLFYVIQFNENENKKK